MRMRLTNLQASRMADACNRFIDDTGLLGYACARNGRKLADACMEYLRMRDDAVMEFGEKEDGTARLSPDMPGWAAFRERIAPFDSLECEADIMKIPASEVIGKMSGRDALSLDWMIEDDAE